MGWLTVLISASLATQWLYRRWGPKQAVIVCIPVLLALFWLTAQSAALLLPNLM